MDVVKNSDKQDASELHNDNHLEIDEVQDGSGNLRITLFKIKNYPQDKKRILFSANTKCQGPSVRHQGESYQGKSQHRYSQQRSSTALPQHYRRRYFSSTGEFRTRVLSSESESADSALTRAS